MSNSRPCARLPLLRPIPVLLLAIFLLSAAPRARAFDLSDAQVRDEMARRSSLFCPDFSNDRGLPGINAVKVDALRVLLSHKYTLCPDRRLSNSIGAIWNSRWGVLLWNPANPQSLAIMAAKADAMTRSLDFPNELMVYDLHGTPLKGQIVPMFEPRDTFTSF
jgi:hypothetical protein